MFNAHKPSRDKVHFDSICNLEVICSALPLDISPKFTILHSSSRLTCYSALQLLSSCPPYLRSELNLAVQTKQQRMPFPDLRNGFLRETPSTSSDVLAIVDGLGKPREQRALCVMELGACKVGGFSHRSSAHEFGNNLVHLDMVVALGCRGPGQVLSCRASYFPVLQQRQIRQIVVMFGGPTPAPVRLIHPGCVSWDDAKRFACLATLYLFFPLARVGLLESFVVGRPISR
jgi:hypothetical protein